jgi:hypothetical protein
MKPPLWPCPACGATFTTRNQSHSCGTFDLDALFVRSDPEVRRLFDDFSAATRRYGPVTVIAQKSRVAFQARMRFAAVTPRRRALAGHLVLRQRHDASCFSQIEKLGNCYRHVFRLEKPADVTALRPWIRLAYRTGTQEDIGHA